VIIADLGRLYLHLAARFPVVDVGRGPWSERNAVAFSVIRGITMGASALSVGWNVMIIRLSQKLANKLKVGRLAAAPLDENPYADWSAHLFTAGRTQYIILTNTRSLYSMVMYGKGITDDGRFIERALADTRELMEGDGQAFVFRRFIAPASGRVRFARALNRSVTGSMNDMVSHAKYWFVEEQLSPDDVSFNLNDIPMSALGYQKPREAFKMLADAGAAEITAASSESAEAEGTSPGPTISVSFTGAQRKALSEISPEIADRLKLHVNAARAIPFAADELETIRRRAEAAMSTAENRMKRNSFRHIVEGTTKALKKSQGIGSIPAAERLYQFKITLLEAAPPIWRRIQVKNCTLDKLHEHIQTAMGWTNSHLHQFEIDGAVYGDPELLYEGWLDERPPVDSLNTRISQIVPKDGRRCSFQYDYDFGDGWQHEVLFEGCLRAGKGNRYPLCVEGERACPPEDVGGVWGYADFLEALADPDHEQHDDYLEWAGPFDSEQFDAKEATKAMRHGLPNWRDTD
jgi:hypothetical protein